MANITAIGFPHKTTEDTQLFDYFVPKDTSVFINLYSVHVDPTQWSNPDEFNPERFLTEEEKVYNHPALMPFSAGRYQYMQKWLKKKPRRREEGGWAGKEER